MMKLVAIFLSVFIFTDLAQADCTLAVTINGAISASTSDYFERAEKRAIEKKCSSLFVRMNTPGGHLQSTRIIVERILASPIPYLCLITPSGGHAGSAGAIILQACHVNGGVTATNIGAATPISGTGEKVPDDLRKKLINDTVSWLEGVTKLRGRNLDFSKEIITEAKSLSSEAAHKENALDILATNEADFLAKAKDRQVILQDKAATAVVVGDLVEFAPDLRHKVLDFIADPEFAYLLFMGSLGLLYVEITHPGMIAPGVIGGMGLVLSMVAFHKLDVAWGGLALILLGIVFLVLEIFVPSFGILGLGGVVSVFVGSLFLFDRETSGYSLSLPLIFSVVGTLAVFCLALGYLALKTIRHKSSDADTDLLNSIGTVIISEANGHAGQIRIMGEFWKFVSEDSLVIGDSVQVTARQGLTLNIKKKV
jgi:membrane-bound serine protease (ClpP class)